MGLSGIYACLGIGLPLLMWVLSRRPGVELVSNRAALQTRLVDGIQGLGDILVFGQSTAFSTKSHCGRKFMQPNPKEARFAHRVFKCVDHPDGESWDAGSGCGCDPPGSDWAGLRRDAGCRYPCLQLPGSKRSYRSLLQHRSFHRISNLLGGCLKWWMLPPLFVIRWV